MRSLLALVAASALLLSGVAVAQDREEIEAKAEERLEQVIENLELTDEQRALLDDYLKEQRQ